MATVAPPDRILDIEVPPELIAGGEHFALEVTGDSMIEAGILDGDVVLIRRGDTADNGDIVVALIDNEEATLKRLRKRGASIASCTCVTSMRSFNSGARRSGDAAAPCVAACRHARQPSNPVACVPAHIFATNRWPILV